MLTGRRVYKNRIFMSRRTIWEEESFGVIVDQEHVSTIIRIYNIQKTPDSLQSTLIVSHVYTK